VIAIIAVLTAVLFPVFAQSKAAAKNGSALSNTRQVALGSLMYSADYNDATVLWQYQHPPFTAWGVLLQPYLGSPDVCFDPARKVPWVPIDELGEWGWDTTISINADTYASGATTGNKTQTSIEHLSQRIAFAVGGDPTKHNWWYGWEQIHWFDSEKSSCPDVNNYKETNPYWAYDYNRLYQGAKDYHLSNLITTEGDGHAKTYPVGQVMVIGQPNVMVACEDTHWVPYYKSKTPTGFDLNLELFWGKWWDITY